MALEIARERQRAHAYLDLLNVEQLSALRRLLESMLSPLDHKLAVVPIDDEPFTGPERKAIAEADEWLKNNHPIPHEQVLAEFDLTMGDWEAMAQEPPTNVSNGSD